MPRFARLAKRRKKPNRDHMAGPIKPDRAVAISRPKHASGSFMDVHQALGNQTVQRMLQSQIIQAKLAVNKPGDRYEQEADRMADHVMRMAEPCPQCQEDEGEKIQTMPLAGQITPLVQRQTAPEEEEKKEEKKKEEETVQTKRTDGGSAQLCPILDAQVRSLKGRGSPLPGSVRDFFEPRFGCDFGHVRVHTDPQAAATARALNAQAFTVGRDVVLGSERSSMQTEDGRRLLAHELTHVVQQNGGSRGSVRVSRSGQSVQRQITVHPASSTVSRIDASRTSAQIGVLAAGGGVAYGLTHHHIPTMVGIPDTMPRMHGRSYQVAVWRADVFPTVDNTIYVASDLGAGSCPFRSTLDHEANHVLDAYAIMVRHREHLISDLAGLPGADNPVAAANVRDARVAREDIRDRMTRIERCVMSQACYDMYRTDRARDAREYPGVFDGCPAPRPPVPRVPARGLVNVRCNPAPGGCPRPVVPFP
jgi:hypothetical protein